MNDRPGTVALRPNRRSHGLRVGSVARPDTRARGFGVDVSGIDAGRRCGGPGCCQLCADEEAYKEAGDG